MAAAKHEPLPGQFRLRALFVLMTLAAVCAWIMSLSIRLKLRMLLVFIVWSCFHIWTMKRMPRPLSRTDGINNGVMQISGQLIVLTFYLTPLFARNNRFWVVDVAFSIFAVAACSFGMWWPLCQIRQALADRPEQSTIG